MVYVPQHFCVLTCAELAKLGKEVVGRSLSYLPCHVITRLHNCSCSTDRSWPFPPPVWYQVCLNFEQKFWHRIHVFCHNLGERQNFKFVVTVFSPKSQLWGDFIWATNFDPVISQNVVGGIGTSEDPGCMSSKKSLALSKKMQIAAGMTSTCHAGEISDVWAQVMKTFDI